MCNLPVIIVFSISSAFATAQTTSDEWQHEAIRLFPEIGQQGSKLNAQFLKSVSAAKKTRPELFSNPKWPMTIAVEITSPSATPASSIVPSEKSPPDASPIAECNQPPETNLLLRTIQQALETKNIPIIIQSCSSFTHKKAVFRAAVFDASREIADASKALAKAMQTKQKIELEIARIRRNAAVSDRPDPFNQNDHTNQSRAQEQRYLANKMEAQVNPPIEQATKELEERLSALGKLVSNIRESDADDERKQAQAKVDAEARASIEIQKAEQLKAKVEDEERTEKERLKSKSVVNSQEFSILKREIEKAPEMFLITRGYITKDKDGISSNPSYSKVQSIARQIGISETEMIVLIDRWQHKYAERKAEGTHATAYILNAALSASVTTLHQHGKGEFANLDISMNAAQANAMAYWTSPLVNLCVAVAAIVSDLDSERRQSVLVDGVPLIEAVRKLGKCIDAGNSEETFQLVSRIVISHPEIFGVSGDLSRFRDDGAIKQK